MRFQGVHKQVGGRPCFAGPRESEQGFWVQGLGFGVGLRAICYLLLGSSFLWQRNSLHNKPKPHLVQALAGPLLQSMLGTILKRVFSTTHLVTATVVIEVSLHSWKRGPCSPIGPAPKHDASDVFKVDTLLQKPCI